MSGWRYAFSLSSAEIKAAEPPGSEKLIEHTISRTISGATHQDDHVQLIPKPSSSPVDPLNWPAWRRNAILFTMSMYAGCATFSAAVVAPALPLLQFEMLPPKSLSALTHLISVNVLLAGCSNIIIVPLANVLGRRLVLIVSLLLATFASLWCGLATSFDCLLAARAIQGVGIAAADTVAPDVIGEVFFLHQRGRTMAIYTAFLGGGSFVGGVAGGYIAAGLGYKYLFWIPTALLGFVLACAIFFVPETLFDRARHLEQDLVTREARENSADSEKDAHTTTHEYVGEARFTYLRSLRVGLYRGGLLRQLAAPWYSLLFPGTWVVMLQYGGLLGGIVTMVTVGPIILAQPPYLWGKNVGLLSIGGLVGTILGALATYLLADRLMKLTAKRTTSGLAEPESRLPAMFPALFFATTGNWVYGFCAQSHGPHAWAGMAVGLGMVGFGVIQIPSIGFNYLIDAYFAISNDCFVMTAISRSVVSFVWTFFVADWVFSAGAALPFGIFGMIMGIFALLTIPLWLYGKRLRIATARYLPTEINH